MFQNLLQKSCQKSKFKDQGNYLPGRIRERYTRKVTFIKVDELRQELWKQERNKTDSKDGSKKELTEF